MVATVGDDHEILDEARLDDGHLLVCLHPHNVDLSVGRF